MGVLAYGDSQTGKGVYIQPIIAVRVELDRLAGDVQIKRVRFLLDGPAQPAEGLPAAAASLTLPWRATPPLATWIPPLAAAESCSLPSAPKTTGPTPSPSRPDGKIVAAGYADNGSDYDFALVRYTASGVPDTTFGSGGVVTTPIGSTFD